MYHIVGDGVKADIYVLDLTKYIRDISPTEFDLPLDMPTIKPTGYYITSGDAIKKTLVLKRDIIGLINKLTSPYADVRRYRSALELLLESVNKMLDDLYFSKGEDLFLEIEWNDHVMYVIPKNPRIK